MKLTASNVESVFADCLFRDHEDKSNAKLIECVLHKFGFHPDRLESHRQDVRNMLADLPNEFHSSGGGGWSFLNACMDKDGNQWGEHHSIEKLLALGIALNDAKILIARERWNLFPGGMPYFSVL